MISFLKSFVKPAVNVTVNTAYRFSDLFGSGSKKSTAYSSMNLSAVYCCVNMYVGALTSIPKIVSRIDSATDQTLRFLSPGDHPAARLWKQSANPKVTSDEMLKKIGQDLLLDGNFYALPQRNSKGQISQYYYIHPSRIGRGSIRVSEGGEKLTLHNRDSVKNELLYHVTVASNERSEVDQSMILLEEDVIHIKGPIDDPEYYRSQGILEHTARTEGLYSDSEKAASSFYRKGYINQMFLGTDSKLAPNVRKELEEKLNKSNDSEISLEDIFKTRILEHGLKPVHVGMPLEQMKFIEVKAYSIEDYGRWFAIPPDLIHSQMGKSVSAVDYEKAMVAWIQNGLGYFMSNVSNGFRDQVLPEPSRPSFQFGFSTLYLYKTTLNESSQALRNFFEIGGIDRAQVADILGVAFDPKDKNNSQRYVPANLITTDHSNALENKAITSIAVMEANIEKTKKGMEIAEKQAEAPKEEPEELSAEKDPDQGNEDGNLDNRIVSNALYASLSGLNSHAVRVINQKKKKEDSEERILNWTPDFQDFIVTNLQDWNPVLNSLLDTDNISLAEEWSISAAEDPDSLEDWFNNKFSSLQKTETE